MANNAKSRQMRRCPIPARGKPINYVDINPHKKTIIICVVSQGRKLSDRKRLFCSGPEQIVPFQVVAAVSGGRRGDGEP